MACSKRKIGSVNLAVQYVADERFFKRPVIVKPAPAWLEALRNRST